MSFPNYSLNVVSLLNKVQRTASARVHHEAPLEGEVGQGPRVHAQDLHQDEETLGLPHLPVRLTSPTSESLTACIEKHSFFPSES